MRSSTSTQTLTAETGVTINLAPVSITATSLPASTQVSFANVGGQGTITLTASAIAAGANWSGYAVGEGIFVGSASDPNANGTTFNPNGSSAYYTISAINGATVTLTQALAASESSATVNLAPVTIVASGPVATSVSTNVNIGSALTSTAVSFANSVNGGTITLTGGGSWAGLGYQVGGGIYVASGTDPNGNGASFNPGGANGYYVITAVNGATLTVNQLLTAESGVTLNVAPVTLNASSTATAVGTAVNFSNVGSNGTITLTASAIAGGANWNNYSVGDGIYIQGTGPNGNGAAFNPGGPNAYYTISAINGNTITLNQRLTAGTNVTVNLAPVTISANVNGAITLTAAAITAGASWSGYAVGQGIYLASGTDPNGNGATFNPNGSNAYYTITAINGATVNVSQALTAESNVTIGLTAVNVIPTGVAFTPASTSVNFANVGGHGTVTLTAAAITAGASWNGYSVGEGIFVGSATDPNANGASFNAGAPNAYYTISAINGSTITLTQQLASAETAATVKLAPVTIGTASLVALRSATVNFGNVGANGTITLTGGSTWAALGYQVGQGIYVASASDPNGNGSTFNASNPNSYYTISAINGAVLTLNQTLIAENGVTINLAPINISASSPTVINTNVNFSNAGGKGTITLTAAAIAAGANWNEYSVGDGIYVASATDPNGNGATFNPNSANAYYTISAINGSTITLNQVLSAESNVTIGLAPVKIVASGLVAAPVNTEVNYSNVAGKGTITLTAAAMAAGANWNSYSVGEGIYIDSSTDPNGNGTTFNPGGADAYYTISAINGATITLNQALTASGVNVGLAPVNTSTNSLVAPRTEVVTFGNVGSNGTITLTGGGTWAALGYQAGDGIYVELGDGPQRQRHDIQSRRLECLLHDRRDQRRDHDVESSRDRRNQRHDRIGAGPDRDLGRQLHHYKQPGERAGRDQCRFRQCRQQWHHHADGGRTCRWCELECLRGR